MLPGNPPNDTRRHGPVRAAIIAAALVMAVAGCGGASGGRVTQPPSNSSANAPSGSGVVDPVAYSRCMRSNGVPDYPDPSSNNPLPTGLPKVNLQQLGVSSSQLQAAEGACAHLLPNGGHTTQAASQQMLSQMVGFSECMRSHGVPNWPDPINGPHGRPIFDLVDVDPPIDNASPRFQRSLHECGHLVPHALGGIPVRQ